MINLGSVTLLLKFKRDGVAHVHVLDRLPSAPSFEDSVSPTMMTFEIASIPIALWEEIEHLATIRPKLESMTRDLANVDFKDRAEPSRTFADVYHRLTKLSQEMRRR